jgi:hypothetical protein
MALANFFDRAATAASQVLANFQLAAFKTKVAVQVIGLAFDDAAVRSKEGVASLDLTVRLLARIYPTLALQPVGSAATAHARTLRALAKSINPAISFARSPKRMMFCIGVGTSLPRFDCKTVFIGSDGWRAMAFLGFVVAVGCATGFAHVQCRGRKTSALFSTQSWRKFRLVNSIPSPFMVDQTAGAEFRNGQETRPLEVGPLRARPDRRHVSVKRQAREIVARQEAFRRQIAIGIKIRTTRCRTFFQQRKLLVGLSLLDFRLFPFLV